MPRYDLNRYWTTHNSYEGGSRGSLPVQLDSKVRCVELDIWDNDYEEFGDYRIGHLKAGHAVACGNGAPDQNPSTRLLQDWLKKIADWSAAHRDHAPITVVLDLKSDLTDNDTGGDLEDLNQKLEGAFGAKLFTRADYDAAGQWPDTAALRNRVIVVFSGDSGTRLSYRYCFGERPAIAADREGRVVLAYRSRAGDMRYWSGTVGARSKRVEWLRKGTYAWHYLYTVSEPSIAMGDDGWIVSVHRIGPAPGLPGPALLESKVGELQGDGRISWGAGRTFTDGLEPSVALVGANKVREIHKTTSGKSLRMREGTLNRKKRKVEWGDAVPTQGPQLPRDTAACLGHQLRCRANARGMILCALDGVQGAVGYRQVGFVELQDEERRDEFVDPLFYGTSASNTTAIEKARTSGLVARAWWFKEGDKAKSPSPPQENMPSTDEPFGPWYGPYMDAGGQTVS